MIDDEVAVLDSKGHLSVEKSGCDHSSYFSPGHCWTGGVQCDEGTIHAHGRGISPGVFNY